MSEDRQQQEGEVRFGKDGVPHYVIQPKSQITYIVLPRIGEKKDG